jgi:hypothetical protein
MRAIDCYAMVYGGFMKIRFLSMILIFAAQAAYGMHSPVDENSGLSSKDFSPASVPLEDSVKDARSLLLKQVKASLAAMEEQSDNPVNSDADRADWKRTLVAYYNSDINQLEQLSKKRGDIGTIFLILQLIEDQQEALIKRKVKEARGITLQLPAFAVIPNPHVAQQAPATAKSVDKKKQKRNSKKADAENLAPR